MHPNQVGQLNRRRTIYFSLGIFAAYAAWTFFNAKGQVLLAQLIPQKSVIGLVMAIDNILAMILQPIFGRWSDRTQSRFGRRIPFIVLGASFSAIFLALLPWVFPIVGSFVLTIALFDISMNVWRSPALAILPDYTAEDQRVKGNSIAQFIGSIGIIVGFILTPVINTLIPTGDWNQAAGFFIVGVLMVILVVIEGSKIKETPTGISFLKIGKERFTMNAVTFQVVSIEQSSCSPPSTSHRRTWQELVDFCRNTDKNILFLFLAVCSWYFAFSAIEAFATQFGIEYLFLDQIEEGGMTVQQAETQVHLIFLYYSLAMILATIPVGFLGHRANRKNTIIVCMVILLALLVYMSVVVVPQRDVATFTAGIFLLAFFWMMAVTTSIPIAWSMAPRDQIGTYTGIYYTFTQIAGVLSPVLLGGILDFGSIWLGANKYWLVFPYMLACIFFALIFVTRITQASSPPLGLTVGDKGTQMLD